MFELTQLVELFQTYGYQAVFLILLLCGFGLPIPEDITLVAGGVISGLGDTDVHTMFFVSMAGVLVGDSTMFTLGRLFGERFLRLRLMQRLVTPTRYQTIQEKFSKHGLWFLFFARFMPGLRSPIFVVAGVTRRVAFWKFLAIDGFAALISVPIWVYLGYFGAHNLDTLIETIEKSQIKILLAVAGLIALALLVRYLKGKLLGQSSTQTSREAPPDTSKPVTREKSSTRHDTSTGS